MPPRKKRNADIAAAATSLNIPSTSGRDTRKKSVKVAVVLGNEHRHKMQKDSVSEIIHPLLLPSVLSVIVEHLHSSDRHRLRLVCKTWNDLIRKKSCPLLNPRIFLHILQYLPDASLLLCRLVCSLWNSVIVESTRWTTHENIDLTYSNFVNKLSVGPTMMERFSQKFGDPSSLPLPLAFTHFTANIFINFDDRAIQDFLVQYGMCIKSLTMDRCKWELEDLRAILFKNAPNLESLRIVCGIIPGTQTGRGKKRTVPELETLLHEDPADYPVLDNLKHIELDMNILDTKDNPRPYVYRFLTELLVCCPNLQSINFDNSSWYTRTWATNFIATNEQIKLTHLKVLKHLIDPDQSQIINLQLKQFPLTTLHIRIRYRDVTLEALHELFCSLKHTLTELQLIFLEYKCAREFPSSQDLYRLKRFELWKYKGQLDFLKDFVALEELLIGEMELKGQELFSHRNVFRALLPNLKKIIFKDYWESRIFS